ncbi:hypothetical protein F2Q69_00006264 [Brassica cretica]|uniref:Uncharacterized protein n=1 Tax=Brassica cretica TaxID=69181 RepID=A0A8S9NXF9_BRACR|nr:hypothetical protein F2Q69_00006264 [Brassica cretica]
MYTEGYDEDYEEERAIEKRATLDKEDRLLHHSFWKEKSPSIDKNGSTSIDTQLHQPNCLRASTDIAYYPSSKLKSTLPEMEITKLEVGQMIAITRATQRDETDQKQAEATWERTHFSHPIDRAIPPSIDFNPSTSININHTTSIDIRPKPKTTVSEKHKFDNQYLTPDEFGIFRDPNVYAKVIDGRTLHVSREDIADILQTANGGDNLCVKQHNFPEHQQNVRKEFYDTAGGIDKHFQQRKFYWEEKDEYGIYIDGPGYARDVEGHIIRVHNKDIRRLRERASRDDLNYICLPEHASSFTQTKLVLEIYTKDEIYETFYGVCGEQEKNKEDIQMKLDGVYYPLNDSISWLSTCMEEMRKDIARIQRVTDVSHPTSIDSHLPASVDNRLPASVDDNPPHSNTMKSQPDFHTREEKDQLVEGTYRALETTEERLDRRCDDIYFPMDLTISDLSSKIEAIQGELVEIQSYIVRRPEVSASIDIRNNKSTDIHRQASVDGASNRGRLVQKVTSDMSDIQNRGEEISAGTYATVMRHQFNLESLGDRLQKIEDATTIMKDKWRRGDEAMRDFTGTWFNKRKEEMETCFPTSANFQHY